MENIHDAHRDNNGKGSEYEIVIQTNMTNHDSSTIEPDVPSMSVYQYVCSC